LPAFAAVLLDLDGLLIDTESVAMAAGLRALAALGHDVGPEVMLRLVGLDRLAGHAVLDDHLGGRLDRGALDRVWGAEIAAHHRAHGYALRPRVGDFFAALDAAGLPRAVVTSSYRKGALRKLALAGLADRVDGVVSRDDVDRAKPDPEPYLRGAALLGAPPARCLAFEDSDTGAAAARAAGCTVVQVPDLVPPRAGHAHHVAADILAGARAAGLIP
jgi:HAD superfamily hydrolase (TIGR01509 family)